MWPYGLFVSRCTLAYVQIRGYEVKPHGRHGKVKGATLTVGAHLAGRFPDQKVGARENRSDIADVATSKAFIVWDERLEGCFFVSSPVLGAMVANFLI